VAEILTLCGAAVGGAVLYWCIEKVRRKLSHRGDRTVFDKIQCDAIPLEKRFQDSPTWHPRRLKKESRILVDELGKFRVDLDGYSNDIDSLSRQIDVVESEAKSKAITREMFYAQVNVMDIDYTTLMGEIQSGLHAYNKKSQTKRALAALLSGMSNEEVVKHTTNRGQIDDLGMRFETTSENIGALGAKVSSCRSVLRDSVDEMLDPSSSGAAEKGKSGGHTF